MGTNDWVYDLECYPYIFTAAFTSVSTRERRVYEISDRIDNSVELHEFLGWLASTNARMVGFNNLGYDYELIHAFMLNPSLGYEGLYAKSMSIIGSHGFQQTVWPSDRLIEQIDLYKICHYDNKAKRTGLKQIEFAMNAESVEDLPYDVGIYLDDYQKDQLIAYNFVDVENTLDFYERLASKIKLREELSRKFNRDFMNHNDTKIGKDYFIMKLEENGVQCFTSGFGGKQPIQSFRPEINLGDCVLPTLEFHHPAFKAVKDWLSSRTITKTKGVFELIEVNRDMASHMNPKLVKVHGLKLDQLKTFNPDCKSSKSGVSISELPGILDSGLDFKLVSGKKDESGLNCVVDGFEFVFGTGGIHGSVPGRTVESDDDTVLIDADVKSFYPNLAIKNNFYPEHLTPLFCNIYSDLYDQRGQYSKKEYPSENTMLKFALNGSYGDSNNQYSPLYDPMFTMKITINGQLLLCKLSEMLMMIPGLEMIQINTDGLTVKLPRNKLELYHSICDRWQDQTRLELEFVEYSKMFIRDVNNYIAVGSDGYVKRKGAYEYLKVEDGGTLEYHQNRSALVVKKAAEAVLLKGYHLESFIKNHRNDFDFMLFTKATGGSKLILNGEFQQKNLRYFMSVDGHQLKVIRTPKKGNKIGDYKRKTGITDDFYATVLSQIEPGTWDERIHTRNKSKYDTTEVSIQGGYNATECNHIKNFDRSKVDYQFYIDEARKLINAVRGES